MADRENVIKHFTDCVDIAEANKNAWVFVRAEELRNALELLNAQEPRVLTLEEAQHAEVVWVEDRETCNIYPCIVKNNMNDSKLYKYGIQWRVWSSRPTDEQREATPWT